MPIMPQTTWALMATSCTWSQTCRAITSSVRVPYIAILLARALEQGTCRSEVLAGHGDRRRREPPRRCCGVLHPLQVLQPMETVMLFQPFLAAAFRCTTARVAKNGWKSITVPMLLGGVEGVGVD